MLIRLLGPIDVVVDGIPRPVPGRRRTAVLAALALRPGEVIGVDELIEIVWGEAAAATAVNTVQSHVSRLRALLGDPDALVARPPGYLLDPGADGTDVQAVETLTRRAAASADLTERESCLRAAMALWRGRPLAELAGIEWFDRQAQRLEELMIQAQVRLIDTRLALGQHLELLTELEDLGRRYPLHEQVQGQLMLALYRAGRPGDAIDAYQRLCKALDEELGIDPTQPIRDLESAIQRNDPALHPSPDAGGDRRVATSVTPVPAQLPLAMGAFTGRAGEIAFLDRLVGDEGSSAGRVVVISGTAGIGKTTLAVHWAHRVAGRFPDGQLYVNLRGFDPSGLALAPATAVRGFLDALGTPSADVPADPEAQVGLYRSLLAGRRMLVVLDNARDAEQVRPLLPGSPHCLTLITSRSMLTAVTATEAAVPLILDLLSTEDARELLAHRIGSRSAAEPDAVGDIIAHCAGLPLALAIVAAHAASHPHFSLAAIDGQLRHSLSSLDGLAAGDPTADVRAVFSWSYAALGADAARLFRLLGLHSGPDVTAPAAASLAGVDGHGVRVLLDELTAANLLAEHEPGRFTFHELLRAYAGEQAAALDAPDARREALRRVLDHYLYVAHVGARQLDTYMPAIAIEAVRKPVAPVVPATVDAALAWFGAERAVLVAAIEQAASADFEGHAWRLAWTLSPFLLRQGRWREHELTQRVALDAARRSGDVEGQAHALNGLGIGIARSGDFERALPFALEAMEMFRRLGDANNQGRAFSGLSWLAERRGRPEEGLRHALAGLECFRSAGNKAGEAGALNDAGYLYALLGDYDQALDYCTRALDLQLNLGEDDHGAWAIWDSVGFVHHRLGEHDKAAECYRSAIEICRRHGDRYNEAQAVDTLGDVLAAAGDAVQARAAWRDALDIFDEVGHPDAAAVRAKLSGAG